jgi:hypothetical protein
LWEANGALPETDEVNKRYVGNVKLTEYAGLKPKKRPGIFMDFAIKVSTTP